MIYLDLDIPSLLSIPIKCTEEGNLIGFYTMFVVCSCSCFVLFACSLVHLFLCFVSVWVGGKERLKGDSRGI